MEKLLFILAMLALAALYFFYQAWIYRDKDNKGPELTGHATVTSHRVEQGRFIGQAPSRWHHLITFTLSDGETIELYVFESVFSSLKDGQTGQLTWQGKNFLRFEPDA